MTERERAQPDMKLEVVVLGVSDVDRAKAFYENLVASAPDPATGKPDPAGNDDDIATVGGLDRPATPEWTAQRDLCAAGEAGECGGRRAGRADGEVEAVRADP